MPGQLPFEMEERKKSRPIKRINYTKDEFNEDMEALTNDVEACAEKALTKYYKQKMDQLSGSSPEYIAKKLPELEKAKAEVKQESNNTKEALESAQSLIDGAFAEDGVEVTDVQDVKEGRDNIISARRNWYDAAKGMNKFSTPMNGQQMAKEQNHVVDGINTAAHNTVLRNGVSDIKKKGMDEELDATPGAKSRYKGTHEKAFQPDDVIMTINASERGVGL